MNLVINLFIWLIKYLTPTYRISIMSFEMIAWYRILFPASFSRTSCIQYCAIMGYVSHYSNVETYNQLDIKRSGWINSPCYVNKITWFFISSRSFLTKLRFSPSLSSFLSPKWIQVREKIKELTFCPKGKTFQFCGRDKRYGASTLTWPLIRQASYWACFTEQLANRIPVRSLRYTNLSYVRFQNMLLRSGVHFWLKMS